MDKTFEEKYINKTQLLNIVCADLFNDYLIIADNKGTLQSLEISKKEANKSNSGYTDLNKCGEVKFAHKVDQICVSKSYDNPIVFILVEGNVEVYQVKTLTQLASLKAIYNNVSAIATNATYPNVILTVNKKKKVKFFEYYPQKKLFSEKLQKNIFYEKDITLNDIPTFGNLEFCENSCYYIAGKKGYYLDLINNISNQFEIENPKTIKYTNQGLLATFPDVGCVGIFFNKGSTKNINPIQFSDTFLVTSVDHKNYLIMLNKSKVLIYLFKGRNYELIQTQELFEGCNGKFIFSNGERVIMLLEATGGVCRVSELKEAPYENQIKLLLESGKFDEALDKLNNNVNVYNSNKYNEIEKFYLSAAWNSLKLRQFENFGKYLVLTNFDPCEYIYMFYSKLGVNIIHSDKEKQITTDISSNQIDYIIKNKSENQNNNEEMDSALNQLIIVLLTKRDYIMKVCSFPKDDFKNISELKFMHNLSSLINLSDSSTEIFVPELLGLMNITLVKAYIQLRKRGEISGVIDNASFNCQHSDFSSDDFFKGDEPEKKIALAYFYEKKGEYEEALKIWKNFGELESKGDNKDTGFLNLEAKEKTKRIFEKFRTDITNRDKNTRLFETYIVWLVKKYPTTAFEVAISSQIVSLDFFLDSIIGKINNENKTNDDLRKLFLEYYNKNCPDPHFQTLLLLYYINKLFSQFSETLTKAEVTIEGVVETNYKSFMNYLKAENSVYNKQTIFDKIKDSWLFEPKIYLYSQLNQHDNAIRELFNDAKMDKKFDSLKQYCEENKEVKQDIYQTYFKILKDEFNKYQDSIDKWNIEIENKNKILNNKIENEKKDITEAEKEQTKGEIEILRKKISDTEEIMKPFEKEMLNLMKTVSIDDLDPKVVLECAGEHWNICDKGPFFEYLMKITEEYTVLSNKFRIAKNLSDKALEYKELENYKLKRRHVNIDQDTLCALCGKKIGNTVFVFYPNMKIYHSKCATNLNVDPTTGVDFTKKKFIN